MYTDIKAAFDSVPHLALLLAKLQILVLPEKKLSCMRSYLAERSYFMKMGLHTSRRIIVSSGVPQGSNLGPLLFVLYLNDATRVLPPDSHLMYANDAKICIPIRTQANRMHIQVMLCTFQSWCFINGLEMCVTKCAVITFTRKRDPFRYDYALDNSILERKSCVRDLRVLLDKGILHPNGSFVAYSMETFILVIILY